MFKADGITFLDSSDFVLAPLYLFAIFIFALLYRNVVLKETPIRKYFITGMLAKIIGGIGVGLIYGFYYKSGDSFYYYWDSQTFNSTLRQGFTPFIKLLMVRANENTTATYDNTWWLTYFRDPSGWMTDKIYGIVS